METRINLNERVKFKLSEHGKEIYRKWHDGLEPKLDDDGYMSIQLWSFMWIFGDHMIPGMPGVLNPIEIIYEQEESNMENENRKMDMDDVIENLPTIEVSEECISKRVISDSLLHRISELNAQGEKAIPVTRELIRFKRFVDDMTPDRRVNQRGGRETGKETKGK